MIPDCFRQDITSTVTVPGDGMSAAGSAAAKAVASVLRALGKGESLAVTPSGPFTAEVAGGAQWLMVQTAGSTGAPKTIRRSPASWIASFEVTRNHFGISADAPYAVLGALAHSLTLYATLEALHLGCDLAVLTGLRPRTQVAAMRDLRVQVLYATPTQLRLLVGSNSKPVESVRWIFSGGGKLDAQTRAQLHEVFPNAAVHEFFGATETSFMTIGDAATPAGSVGRAYPGVDLRVLDPQGAATNDVGEIWVKSPYLFDGYVDRASADTSWQDGYLSIGEMGQLDKAGNLTVLGRKNRMVTVADHNVFPEAIEAQLQFLPNVEKCVVLPVLDAKRGHRIVVIVQGPRDDVLAQNITETCRTALGTHATPRRIVFVDKLPLLGAGKPDLLQLAKMLEQPV
ncbi:AMP-binding protein [Aliiroseovarius sp. S1339]|uniref:AMP-binding protein n=1 Tax=Aliiroseovarius sp. S1339 TaxID=2936990 RepID=UPI0020C0D8AA|nr:AMP-binding protein [Aliiroseovarius sp. S1339]MCK8464984.1 AMP-binding protein [Aliiroseovarius sp. S1339]